MDDGIRSCTSLPQQRQHQQLSKFASVPNSMANSSASNDYDTNNNQQEDIYVHVKFLGCGSFGSVNLYRYNKTNTLVVWKEVDLNRLDAKLRTEAFGEIEILSMLDHSNIITYYKHFICDNYLYIELEYANGGSLMHIIKQQRTQQEHFKEHTVLWYLYQLCSAVEYTHEFGILHRDIKSLNIFCMKSGLIKLGDFGIAKILDPEIGAAETQVGTPYYMSPEIISGTKYTTKSDIWSVGCVLYEMMSLKKVFDGSNQLKLAMKIISCEIDEEHIAQYSDQIKALVRQLLNKDPDARPSAKDILASEMFADKILEYESKIEHLNAMSRKLRTSNNAIKELGDDSVLSGFSQDYPVVASKLSECYIFGGGKKIPQKLECFNQENAPLQVAVGFSHYAVITAEKELFTWAASQGGSRPMNHAKLGHGKSSGVTRHPKRVEALNTIFIKQVACGEDFTLCISEDGTLYSFGNDYCGCLGLENPNDDSGAEDEKAVHDDSNNVYLPTPVSFFAKHGIKIIRISCGDNHAIALTETNEVYTWGCGEFGRLGHGTEDDAYEPKKILLPLKYTFKDVVAGVDCSFIITSKGRVFSFGNNEDNKLCLNTYAIGLKNMNTKKDLKMSANVEYQLVPQLIKDLRNYNIVKLACGTNHTAAIDSFGRLFTFGSNKFGQLGVGDCKPRDGINMVGSSLRGHHIINVSCGDTFTICATAENHVFSWGNKKDGRLGLDTKFDDTSYVCSPRPIFGSLHLVSDMCSKFWNSIIIAEQIINAKPLRSTRSARHFVQNQIKNLSEPDSAYETYAEQQDQAASNNLLSNNEDTNSSTAPEWLKRDLADADYIPIEALNSSQMKFQTNNSTIPNWLKVDLDEAEYIPIEALNFSQSSKSLKIPAPETPIKDEQDNSDDDDYEMIQTMDDALELIRKLRIENEHLKSINGQVLV